MGIRAQSARSQFAAPGAIGGTTPAAITGTAIVGTTYAVGATAGVDASIVIPAVATITVTKGIITAVV